jgi:hypothetical protein
MREGRRGGGALRAARGWDGMREGVEGAAG